MFTLYKRFNSVYLSSCVPHNCRIFSHLLVISCTSAGFLILSGTNLYSLFWLLYISHLALKIFYPLKSIQVFNSDHSREVFIAEILIAFFIATAPSIVSIGLSNIGIVTFPPIQCGNSNRTYCFYTAVLPVMIVTCISGSLMILALYKLHMVNTIIMGI